MHFQDDTNPEDPRRLKYDGSETLAINKVVIGLETNLTTQ
jgi:hypothetical protein